MRSLQPMALFLGAAWTATSANAHWDPRFFLPGIQGEVSAIAISGADIYAGGRFTSVDNVPATNVARWNGTNWSALGTGINGEVLAIAVSGSTVYAGGTFTNAGGVAANRIAKWDGTTWAALGSGVNGTSVDALAVGPDGALYAGGSFDFIGSLGATNLARWDGADWAQVGGGVDSSFYPPRVAALVFIGNDLFVGGLFTEVGGVNARHIARWNGVAWSALGGGVDDPDYPAQITALAVIGGDLYVGGSFSSAGSTRARNVARWDGSGWFALGDGLERFFGDIPATALAASGGRMVAGGRFESAGGVAAENLAVWDGASWSEVGGGATGRISALAASGTQLYVGGTFTVTAAAAPFALAAWNGAQWRNVSAGGGEGINGARNCVTTGCQGDEVEALAISGDVLYAAGGFASGGNTATRNVARWNGTQWSPLGNGLEGNVHALTLLGSNLYAGGKFSVPGAISVSNLAQWDGANWSGASGTINGPVYALTTGGDHLYAGGQFTAAGGVSATNLARWNGSNWAALATGVNGPVYALAINGGNLYVGGKFTSAGGTPATNLAQWNGSSWSALGGGVSGVVNPFVRVRPPPVSALAVDGNSLYAGGDFAFAGGLPATNIARWDGTGWLPLGHGVIGSGGFAPPPTVAALAVNGSGLYVGGSFSKAGGLAVNNVAQWDGRNWTALGDGLAVGISSPASVQALAVTKTGLFVGGHFKFAGGKPASDFSIWHDSLLIQIQHLAGTVRISWPSSAQAYILETTENLSAGSWQVATNIPVIAGDEAAVMLVPSAVHGFYRLRN